MTTGLIGLKRRFEVPLLRPDVGFDSAKLTGLVDSDSVTDWAAVIGGITPTQATAAKKPTYRTAQQNGLPWVSFDGVDDVLIATDPAVTDVGLGDFTVIMVYRPESLLVFQAIAYKGAVSDTDTGWGVYQNSGTLALFLSDGVTRFSGGMAIPTVSLPYIAIWVNDRDGLQTRYRDGVQISTTDISAFSDNNLNSAVGFNLSGVSAIPDHPYNGKLMEWWLAKRALDVSEVQWAFRGLGPKWGIKVS